MLIGQTAIVPDQQQIDVSGSMWVGEIGIFEYDAPAAGRSHIDYSVGVGQISGLSQGDRITFSSIIRPPGFCDSTTTDDTFVTLVLEPDPDHFWVETGSVLAGNSVDFAFAAGPQQLALCLYASVSNVRGDPIGDWNFEPSAGDIAVIFVEGSDFLPLRQLGR